MQEYGSSFASEQSMGNIGGIVSVAITDSVDTRDIGDKSSRLVGLESSAIQRNTSLLTHVRALLVSEAGQERSALNRLALCELNAE